MSLFNSAPQPRTAQEKVEPALLKESVVIDRQTVATIFGQGSNGGLARFPGTYNTNNGWVNFCDTQGNLRAMPVDSEVIGALSEAGYKADPKIMVVDSNILTDINRVRQQGGNTNFAKGLEESLLSAFEASQARLTKPEPGDLDKKYSV